MDAKWRKFVPTPCDGEYLSVKQKFFQAKTLKQAKLLSNGRPVSSVKEITNSDVHFCHHCLIFDMIDDLFSMALKINIFMIL